MKSIYEWFAMKFLKSSKFWLAVAGVAATFLSDKLGLNQEETYSVLAAIVALILGKAIEDAGRNSNPANKLPQPKNGGGL